MVRDWTLDSSQGWSKVYEEWNVDLANLFCVWKLTHTRKSTMEDIHNKIKSVGLSEYLSYSSIICFRDEK